MTAPSISRASRPPIELNSIPSDDAAVCSTANCAIPAGRLESRRTATRVTPGATSRMSSSHFPLMPYSIDVKPVALPPGRARLWTKPAPTGSGVSVNTIGTVRVTCSNDPATAPPLARTTSGASARGSAAYLRMGSASPAPQRVSICTLPGTAQPACRNPRRNAAMRACPSASSAVVDMSTPMRRIRSLCARAASGYAAAAPPSSDRNWRRLMRSPRPGPHRVEVLYHMSQALWVTTNVPGNVLRWVKKTGPVPSLRRRAVKAQRPFWSNPETAFSPAERRNAYVRSAPESGQRPDMSVCLLHANRDLTHCSTKAVLFDRFVGPHERYWRDIETECPRVFAR